MDFPKGWFEDEIRDGFFVNGMMKRAWAAQLEVLSDIDRVCQKHGISWFADCGTLLGAVRHGGFIPWDDDIDICMLRDDYDRFRSVAKAELPSDYVVLDFHHEGFNELLTFVGSGSSIRMDGEYLAKYHGFPFVAGIDVFPLDYASPDPEEEALRTDLANALCAAAGCASRKEALSSEALALIHKAEELCRTRLDFKKPLKPQLMELAVSLYRKYDRTTASEIFLLPYWVDHQDHRYRLEWFQETMLLPFETTYISVPAMYEEILLTEYGEQYMTPVIGGGIHGYPFYGVQEQLLIDHLGGNYPFRFRFERSGLTMPRETGSTSRPEEVLFLPSRASMWSSMEAVWEKEKADQSRKVTVLPIPWFDRTPDGSLGEMHYEGEHFPPEIIALPLQNYDVQNMHASRIYIQDPFDDCDYSVSTHPVFYARNLKDLCDELILIPCFLPDDSAVQSAPGRLSLDHLALVPGVYFSDHTLLPSDTLRAAFIEKLTEWGGEDTREIWEKKLLCSELAKSGKPASETKPIPEEWRIRLTTPDGSRKKVILYVTGLSALLAYGKKALAKYRTVFSLFREQKEEVLLLWMPFFSDTEKALVSREELHREYQALLSAYRNEDFGLFDPCMQWDSALSLADAYYGDPSPLIRKFNQANKPVMLQNIDDI